MTSLQALFDERATGPYGRPVKVNVVSRGEVQNYQGNDGTQKQYLTVAVSDGITCLKLICYDGAKFGKLTVGQTVVLREIIRRTEDQERTIVVTKTSKVYVSSGLEVPPEHKTVGDRVVNPPPAEVMPITEALRSPAKKRVSIKGKIIQEDEARTVSVKGTDVQIKTVTVQDLSGKSKVTLWRECSETEARPGDYVTLNDLVINTFRQETTLSTTSRSHVQKCDAPLEESSLTVTGIALEDGKVELLLEDDEVEVLPAEVLQGCMEGESPDVESLTVNGPIVIKLTSRGSEVLSASVSSQ